VNFGWDRDQFSDQLHTGGFSGGVSCAAQAQQEGAAAFQGKLVVGVAPAVGQKLD
jgi:hypothetical protein